MLMVGCICDFGIFDCGIFDCGLRIADCGLRIEEGIQQSAICNQQLAISN
jgi:hypothetical protein